MRDILWIDRGAPLPADVREWNPSAKPVELVDDEDFMRAAYSSTNLDAPDYPAPSTHRPVAEWVELNCDFPPVPSPLLPGRPRRTDLVEELKRWKQALEDKPTGAERHLIQRINRQLGIDPPQMTQRPFCRLTVLSVDGPGYTEEWEPGDYVPGHYKPAAKTMTKLCDLMHWLTLMDWLCGLDEDLKGRLAAIRPTLWAGG